MQDNKTVLTLTLNPCCSMSQRDRLRAELEYMERLRGIKRRREMLPHRAQLDLLMGGKKVEFSERYNSLLTHVPTKSVSANNTSMNLKA